MNGFSRRYKLVSAATALALAIVAGACGGDDDEDPTAGATDAPTSHSTATTAPESTATTAPESTATTAPESTATTAPESTDGGDPLGPENAATGSTVKIGLMIESGFAAQAALAEQGAKIATSYINDYRGGIGGHKVELITCGNQSTPAGDLDCANQFVEQGVEAVLWPYNSQGTSVQVIADAGIPIIAGSGSTAAELTTPGVFVLTGGFPGQLGAWAADAKSRGIQKFVNITIDVPAAVSAAEDLGGLAFANAGVDYEVITAPFGTPDLSAQLQQAVSDGADAVGFTGEVTFCTSALQAYETLGMTLDKYLIGVCTDQAISDALPNAFEGARLASLVVPGPDDDLYAAMVAKYGDSSIDPDPQKSIGVSIVVDTFMHFLAAMNGFEGDATSQSLKTQLSTTEGELFRSGGLTFRCDGSAIPILPNICSAAFQMVVLSADGTQSSATKIDASEFFAS